LSVRPANQRTRQRQASHTRRQARFAAVADLQAAGSSVRAIAAQLGMGRQTVRRYLRAGAPPSDHRRRRPSQVAPFDGYLRERWAAGEQNVSALWRELRALGFTGGKTSVSEYVAPWRTSPGRRGPAARLPVPSPSAPPPHGRVPSAREATGWLMAEPADLTPDQHALRTQLCAAVPQIQTARELVRAFGSLVRQRRAADLEAWLE
jgi:hypothetical protein